MTTVTASEFQKNFGAYKEKAQREPVIVTSNGRESVVVISAVDKSMISYNSHSIACRKLKNITLSIRK